LDINFKFQRNNEIQLERLFERHKRRENRRHIVDEKIEIKKAKREAISSSLSYKKTGQLQLSTTAVAPADKRFIARVADRAVYETQKRVYSLQSFLLYIAAGLADAWKAEKPRRPLYVACLAILAASLAAWGAIDALYGYDVTFNGYYIGKVRDRSVLTEALSLADSRFAEWYHSDSLTYERTITISSAYLGFAKTGEEALSVQGCLERIFACNIPIFASGGVIEVNGVEAVRLASVADAEYAIAHLADSATSEGENVVEVRGSTINEEVVAKPRTVEMSTVKSVSEAVAQLTAGPSYLEVGYGAGAGESVVDALSADNDSENNGLKTALNFREDEFSVGETSAKPKVTFTTVKVVEYTVQTPYKKTYQSDSSLLVGQQKVIQEGKAGQMLLRDTVTVVGNQEVSRINNYQEEIVAPTDAIIAKGTREITVISEGASSGDFMLPVGGHVTSFSATRSGSHANYHAIDVGCPTGTNVVAAKGGTVTMAEYYSTYGNCVQIKHADGYSTLYAHLSKFKVSVGDVVEQGELIALSGNTGRSTGPHCHFEIRKNGERLDLRNFFSVKEGATIKQGLASK